MFSVACSAGVARLLGTFPVVRFSRLIAITLSITTASLLAGCDSKTSLARFHAIDITGAPYAQDFHLKAADGSERSIADFRGKVVLVFFGFTQCPDVCPTALTRAAEVKRLLSPQGDRFQAVFITVDPERDIPAVLREYTQAFDPSFIGLYGDLAQTRKTADDFRVHYAKVPTGSSYTMDHTATSYVFDSTGKLRLAASHGLTAADLAADVAALLNVAAADKK